jgi:hypothetical protein
VTAEALKYLFSLLQEVCTYLPGKGKVLFQLIKKGQRYDQGHNGMGNLHDGVPVDIR